MEAKFVDLPIVLHDERFTTATAHQSLKDRNMKAQDRRHVVDKVAAAVLLQTWLDGQTKRWPDGSPTDAQIRPDFPVTVGTAGPGQGFGYDE